MFVVVNNRTGDIVGRFRSVQRAISHAQVLTDTQAWIDGGTYGVQTA